MKDAADARVEFVELVDRPAAVNVPQDSVVQNQLVGHVECGTIACVVVRAFRIVKTGEFPTSGDVVNLEKQKQHHRHMWRENNCSVHSKSEHMLR